MEQTIRTGLEHKVDAAGYEPDLVLQTDEDGKVIAGKVQTEHFADGAVTREKIADGALTNIAFSMNASDLIDMTKLHLPDIPPKDTGRYVFMYNVDADAFAFEPIPESYTFLEYIQTTGVQYIYTDHVVTSNTGVKSKIQYTHTYTTEQYPYGMTAWGTGERFAFGLPEADGTGFLGYGTRSDRHRLSWAVGQNYVMSFGKIDGFYGAKRDSTTVITYSGAQQFPSKRALSIFGRTNNPGYAWNLFVGKMYYLDIYENNELMCHIVPARRDSDGTLGMYDVVNKKFYTNAGTGTFIAGPDL